MSLSMTLIAAAGCAAFGGSTASAHGALSAVCTWRAPTLGTAVHTGVPLTSVPAAGAAVMTIKTGYGPIKVRMDRARTPCTIASFAYLGGADYFTDSICHRLTTKAIFVLQCGDPTGKGTGGPSYTVPDEALPVIEPAPQPELTAGNPCDPPYAGCTYTYTPPPPVKATCPVTATPDQCQIHEGEPAIYPRGTVAMANDGEPNNNGSQFFIVWKDTGLLAPTYTPFGQVIEGMDIVDMIAKVGAYGDNGDGEPRQPVTVLSITVTSS